MDSWRLKFCFFKNSKNSYFWESLFRNYDMLLEKIRNQEVSFQEVIAHVDEHYTFVPTAFKNGETFNEARQNSGSCKLFSFAKLSGLTEQETLYCFGDYYKDVLNTPNGTDHQNIRNFMQFGWQGIAFEREALKIK